jgi:hypothetical protein
VERNLARFCVRESGTMLLRLPLADSDFFRGMGAFMKRSALLTSFAFMLLTLVVGAGEPLSTDRYVHGVITSLDTGSITIASEKASVTGRIDPVRTKIRMNGKPAKLADLKVTEHAKAELCLDDVWVVVDAH